MPLLPSPDSRSPISWQRVSSPVAAASRGSSSGHTSQHLSSFPTGFSSARRVSSPNISYSRTAHRKASNCDRFVRKNRRFSSRLAQGSSKTGKSLAICRFCCSLVQVAHRYCASRARATISAISSTCSLSSASTPLRPSSNMVMQKGQAAASTSASVARASLMRA